MKNVLGTALLKLLAYKCNKSLIVSLYTSHEWISTIHSRSMRLTKFAYYLKGYNPYSKHNSNVNLEWFDPKKDQATYYTPY